MLSCRLKANPAPAVEAAPNLLLLPAALLIPPGVPLLCSKAAHRVSTLLQAHFGLSDVTESSPRLFASLLPPEEKKVEALR